MPDARAAIFDAMAGRKKPKPRSSKRDGRRGRVSCTDACPGQPEGCKCEWACWLRDGEKAKVHHIRIGLDHDCLKHSLTAKAKVAAWRNDTTIVRPMNGGPG